MIPIGIDSLQLELFPNIYQETMQSSVKGMVGAGTVFLVFVPICFLRLAWWCVSRIFASCWIRSRDQYCACSRRDGIFPGKVLPLAYSSPTLFFRCLGFWAELGALLLYVWLCEKFSRASNEERPANTNLIWGVLALFISLSLCNLQESRGPDKNVGGARRQLLNDEQMQEWKGWMLLFFLAYHYFPEISIQNAVTCFISCYIWMIGFKHAFRFYVKRDFGVIQLLQTVWRLNFLVFWLCLIFNHSNIFYHLNALLTFYYFATFFVMRVWQNWNHNHWFLRTKVASLGCACYAIWEFKSVFPPIFKPVLSLYPGTGFTSGVLHEWYFRTTVHHWSAVFGIAFAINYPAAKTWFCRVDGDAALNTPGKIVNKKGFVDNHMEDSMVREVAPLIENASEQATQNEFNWNRFDSAVSKIIILAPLMIGFMIWFGTIYMLPTQAYNSNHPYYFIIPLLLYVYVRNSTKFLRRYYSSSLAFLGKLTIEAYVMHHHVWLCRNGQTALVVVPSYPLLNLVITTITFMYISWRLFELTDALREMYISRSKGIMSAFVGVGSMSLLIFISYSVSFVLVRSNVGFVGFALASMFIILPILCFGAYKLHHTFWSANIPRQNSAGHGHTENVHEILFSDNQTVSPRTNMFVLCILLFLALSMQIESWTKNGILGQDRVTNTTVFNSEKVPNSISEKALFNNYGDSIFLSKLPCLRYFDSTEATDLMRHRNVYIMGDSVGRYLMLALSQAMNFENGTSIEFSMKDRHRDKSFKLEDGSIWKFYWSPFALGSSRRIFDEMLSTDLSKMYHESGNNLQKKSILLISNGLWDMLHHEASRSLMDIGEAINSLADSFGSSKNLHRLWLIPTVVEPSKLPARKRKNMTVKACWDYRSYVLSRARVNVSQTQSQMVSFLDGLKFTDRPDVRSLSTDGVHYKKEVYAALAQGVFNLIYAKEYEDNVSFHEIDGLYDPSSGFGKHFRSESQCVDSLANRGLVPDKMFSVRHNPSLGFLVLILLIAMLFLTDSFAGLSRLSFRYATSKAIIPNVGYDEASRGAFGAVAESMPDQPVLW